MLSEQVKKEIIKIIESEETSSPRILRRSLRLPNFLLRGLRKVTGEFALMCLGYNIKQAKNPLGYEKMMEMMMA